MISLRFFAPLLLILPCSAVPRRAIVGGAPVALEAIPLDGQTILGPVHYGDGRPARNRDGTVNAVIEIPAGTIAKFEVDASGMLRWSKDRDTGRPRELDYLPFVVNYGMVPRTLADDGDALDVIVLARGIERGHIARTRVIGVLKMGEPAERDDKLVAVPVEDALQNGFSRLHELAELDAAYPGSRAILELWFSNYWGAGATHVLGWGDAREASEILDDAERRFTEGPRSAPRAAADLRRAAWSPSSAPAR